MTDYLNKSFSVYPGGSGSQDYRDNWDRIFGKKVACCDDGARYEAETGAHSDDHPGPCTVEATEMPGPVVLPSRKVVCSRCGEGADPPDFVCATCVGGAADGSGKEKAQPG